MLLDTSHQLPLASLWANLVDTNTAPPLFTLSTVPKLVPHHGECPSENRETDIGISSTLSVSLSDAPRVPDLSSCLSDELVLPFHPSEVLSLYLSGRVCFLSGWCARVFRSPLAGTEVTIILHGVYRFFPQDFLFVCLFWFVYAMRGFSVNVHVFPPFFCVYIRKKRK